MSVLSLPFDKLNRLHLAIRLNQTPGSLSFSLESISPSELPPNPSSRDNGNSASGSSYCMNFQTGHDDRGPVLKIFSSCADSGPSNEGTSAPSTSAAGMQSQQPQPQPQSQSHSQQQQQPQQQSSPTQTQAQPAQSTSSSSSEEFPQHFAPANSEAPAQGMIDGLFNAGFFSQSFSDGTSMPFGSLLSCLDTNMQDTNMQDATSPEGQKDTFLPGTHDQQQQFNWGDDAFLQSLDLNVEGQPSPQTELPESLFSDEWMLTPPTSVTSLSSSASSSSSRYSSPASDIADPPASAGSPEAKSTTSPSKRHDRYDRRRFPCPIPDCNRRFTSQYTLKVHVKAHRPKPRPCFPCTLGCNEQFSRQHDRLRHEVAKHRKVCEWSCAECGRFFSSSKTLGNHKCKVATGKSSMRWMSESSAPTPAPQPIAVA